MESKLLQPSKIQRFLRNLSLMLCCALMLPFSSSAQLPTTAAAYPFVSSNKPFTYLSSGTPITFGNWDDGYVQNIPIGFPFTFCGVPYTTVTAHTNGYMCFGNNTNMYLGASQSAMQYMAPAVIAQWHDAYGQNASTTPVTYTTIGTAPNRVFILEFKNWGTCCSPAFYISYQYILHEGGAVEILYDQVGSGNFPSYAAVGIARNQNDFQMLPNLSASPTPNSTTWVTCGGGRPATGQSYLWGLIPCTGIPEFEVTGPTQVCPGKPFSLTVSGTGIISGLTFQWESSNDGTTWNTIIGATTNSISDVITTPMWYRCNITCTNSGLSYTTQPWKINIADFMFCYCDNGAATATGLDIGNVTLIEQSIYKAKSDTILNNGVASPPSGNATANKTYSTFQHTLPPIVMYRDSVYRISVSRITSATASATNPIKDANVTVFIDLDRDGVFDATDKVMQTQINSLSLIADTEVDTFQIPMSAEIGLTGMRVVLRDAPNNADSCGFSGEGETEDYIVDMRYEPCSGPVNPGAGQATDTSICAGYDYIVLDTTYEKKKSELQRFWQVSGDNVYWSNITASTDKDTLMRVFGGQPLYYRVRMICQATNDTTYSDPVLVNAKAGYKCYCYSQSMGGKSDSSDIGGITVGPYTVYTGGPHVLNPDANRKRTDHTDDTPMILDVDSTYNLVVYHTQRSIEHADAKITIFMDFNNNKQYDVPYERVFTGYTGIGNFTIADNVTIPSTVITGLETGLRVVLNNDLAPNIPSDEACGPYSSGETEDYIVRFERRLFPAGVNATNAISSFGMYPNPTKGKFVLQFASAAAFDNVDVTIANITGQLVYNNTYKHNGGQFSQEINLTELPRGVYMVTLAAGGEKQIQKLVIE